MRLTSGQYGKAGFLFSGKIEQMVLDFSSEKYFLFVYDYTDMRQKLHRP
jgi:hypothetical protein